MKTMKKVISVALLGAMAFSIAGCGKNYQVVSKKDFTNALEDVCDLDEDDWYVVIGDTTLHRYYNAIIDKDTLEYLGTVPIA